MLCGSAQHMRPRTLIVSMLMKKFALIADLWRERQGMSEFKEAVQACRASGDVGCSPCLSVQRGQPCREDRPHGLPAVRACGEHQRDSLGLPLVRVGGVGLRGGTVSQTRQGAGVGAVQTVRRATCPHNEDSILMMRTRPRSRRGVCGSDRLFGS